jgi:recombination protein RecA
MQTSKYDPEKLSVVNEAILQINKTYGKGTIMFLGSAVTPTDAMPTGSYMLDYLLRIGGYPKGRIVEVYGAESSGKTTLCLHTAAACQHRGGSVAYIDAEHAIDLNYAKNLGVDTKNLLLSQPGCGEEGLSITETLTSSGAIDLIIVDSVAALVPRAEIEGEMGDSSMAVQARLMSQAMRKLTGIVSKTNTVLVFINQLRDKINTGYGPRETTTGGNALKFYASVRIDIRKIAAIKDKDIVVGNKARVKVVKSKVSPPFTEGEIEIYYKDRNIL